MISKLAGKSKLEATGPLKFNDWSLIMFSMDFQFSGHMADWHKTSFGAYCASNVWYEVGLYDECR